MQVSGYLLNNYKNNYSHHSYLMLGNVDWDDLVIRDATIPEI